MKKIFHYLSGVDLHHVWCVKRSLRDIIVSMLNSKADRDLFEKKLEQQWAGQRPRSRMLYEAYGFIAEKIKHSDQDLFFTSPNHLEICVQGMDEMYKVVEFARWHNQLKYSILIEKYFPHGKIIWDVHKDFVMVSERDKIRCWNRKTQKEMKIYDKSAKLQVILSFVHLRVFFQRYDITSLKNKILCCSKSSSSKWCLDRFAKRSTFCL